MFCKREGIISFRKKNDEFRYILNLYKKDSSRYIKERHFCLHRNQIQCPFWQMIIKFQRK